MQARRARNISSTAWRKNGGSVKETFRNIFAFLKAIAFIVGSIALFALVLIAIDPHGMNVNSCYDGGGIWDGKKNECVGERIQIARCFSHDGVWDDELNICRFDCVNWKECCVPLPASE